MYEYVCQIPNWRKLEKKKKSERDIEIETQRDQQRHGQNQTTDRKTTVLTGG